MSILVIRNTAFITLSSLAVSPPDSSRGTISGTTCQETPNRSFSQPQGCSRPPPSISFSQ